MTEHRFTLTQMREAIRQVEAGGHSVFAPSASPMWMGCPGSLIPNLFAPDDAGEDAAYGTVGHMVGEVWNKTGKKPVHLLGTTHHVEGSDWFFIVVDEEMLDYVEQYVRWCRMLPGEHFTETRVDFSQLTPIPNQGGTADHAACQPGILVITDLKMGKGVKVFAEKNSQGLLYALGFFYEWDWLYDFKRIIIRIAQPRLDHWDEWEVSREDLLAFAEEVRACAAAAWVQNAPRRPSDKACQWCRVAATCGPRIKQVIDVSEGRLEALGREVSAEEVQAFREKLHDGEWELAEMNPLELSTADLEKIFAMSKTIDRLWKAIFAELNHRAADGQRMTMYKLAEGITRRVFKAPKQAEKRLLELGLAPTEIYKKTMISPAQTEEALRKKGYKKDELLGLMKGLVYKPPGGATLVPIQDSRPALDDRYGDVFGDD